MVKHSKLYVSNATTPALCTACIFMTLGCMGMKGMKNAIFGGVGVPRNIRMLLCELCFWSASEMGTGAVSSCPVCRGRVRSVPVASG